MSKLKLYIISANMLLVLGFFFFNIIKNESVLNDGEIVLLRLRPVDPRSIMQGDYMALRFSLGDQIGHRARWDMTKDFEDIISNDGETGKYCVARLDDNNVGHFCKTD